MCLGLPEKCLQDRLASKTEAWSALKIISTPEFSTLRSPEVLHTDLVLCPPSITCSVVEVRWQSKRYECARRRPAKGLVLLLYWLWQDHIAWSSKLFQASNLGVRPPRHSSEGNNLSALSWSRRSDNQARHHRIAAYLVKSLPTLACYPVLHLKCICSEHDWVSLKCQECKVPFKPILLLWLHTPDSVFFWTSRLPITPSNAMNYPLYTLQRMIERCKSTICNLWWTSASIGLKMPS